jgi:hypothetical protein
MVYWKYLLRREIRGPGDALALQVWSKHDAPAHQVVRLQCIRLTRGAAPCL